MTVEALFLAPEDFENRVRLERLSEKERERVCVCVGA